MFRVSWGLIGSASTLLSFAFAQDIQPTNAPPQSSWPQAYPGMPTGDFGPEWQNYFQVTENLPNVTWPLARNWAGNIPVQRPGHPNNTLFFWAFESSEGSFTANNTEPWGIWLNGGPGASSLLGLLFENGPIHIRSNYTAFENQYAWTTIADYIWIDQPVGTGFSTCDLEGFVSDEDQMASDFMGFLENLVKVFPNLATRPLYITGESYAGTYIPYITKAYFGMENPPINLAAIAIGDGTLTNFETYTELPVITVLETYPQIIGYDPEVFEYFQEQSTLCGYNLTLQYPQPEQFPTLNAPLPSAGGSVSEYNVKLMKRFLAHDPVNTRDGSRVDSRNAWKRDLAGRDNGTIDPWYQCDLYSEMLDYAINFTYPWSDGQVFDYYNIPDALSPEVTFDGTVFLNDPQTRAALHAPTSKDWASDIVYPFSSTNVPMNPYGDPSVEPMAFLTELATNATAHGIAVIIFSGNDDSLVPHVGSEIAIQNTTFGGIRGFTRKPETAWYNDEGEFAGIVHQERGWKYILADHAGHALSYTNPISALTLAREFIFGNNPTGLVMGISPGTVVVGGEDHSFGNDVMIGQAGIYVGSATTMSTYFFPSATVGAWNAYMSAATATRNPRPSNGH